MAKTKLLIFTRDEEKKWLEAIEKMGLSSRCEVEIKTSLDEIFFKESDFREALISWSLFDQWVLETPEYFGLSVSSLAKQVHFFDYLEKKHSSLQAHNLLHKSFKETILQTYPKIENRRPAFFIGHGPFLRSACMTLITLGFNKFYVCSPDLKLAKVDIQILQKSFFGVQFQLLSTDEVTQLQDSASIVVNTLNGEIKSTFNEDLSYFNYLHLSGAVFDLYPEADQKFYSEEAQRAGLVVIPSQILFENILKNMTRV